ncbi:hypothetical protein [Ruania alba]|uniref:Uncharacterized protein n=1 Tax=Ruania alba TaxID=648782 RepID=A0A1H5L1U8_9MICO|nr:hypothetical protein [Ruania alba]SEE70940.1 hypothetical protein SAMN04488554_2568 [Ruania alba]
MVPLLTPTRRRRLGTVHIALGCLGAVVTVLLPLAGIGAVNAAGNGGPALPVPVAVPLFVVLTGLVAVYTVHLFRKAARWMRAAGTPALAGATTGQVQEISTNRFRTRVRVDVPDRSPSMLLTEDGLDTSSVVGDQLQLEWYLVEARAMGAYRNIRTGRVRAVTGLLP